MSLTVKLMLSPLLVAQAVATRVAHAAPARGRRRRAAARPAAGRCCGC